MEKEAGCAFNQHVASLAELWRDLDGWLEETSHALQALLDSLHGIVIPVARDDWGDVRQWHEHRVWSEKVHTPQCEGRFGRFFLVHQLMM